MFQGSGGGGGGPSRGSATTADARTSVDKATAAPVTPPDPVGNQGSDGGCSIEAGRPPGVMASSFPCASLMVLVFASYRRRATRRIH
jgi:hypothetical protein